MNLPTPLRLLIIVRSLILAFQCHAQSSFVNLNFEQGSVVILTNGNYYPYSVATTNALPGWNVSYGTTPQTQITYNDPSIGSTWVSIMVTNGYGANIAGRITVFLQSGVTASAATISQTGLVPAGSQSLLFKAASLGGSPSELDVSLGDQEIPFTALSSTSAYTLYGGDISAFSGLFETLSFSAPNLSSQGNIDNNWFIDDISFSPSPIPEPATWALISCGLGLFTIVRFRNSIRP